MNITEIVPMTDHRNYIPIGNKILIALPREDVNEMVKVEGILQPKGLAQKNNPMRESEVIQVGPLCKQVEKGDIVMWNINSARPFPIGDFDVYFLAEEYVECITQKAKRSNGFPFPVAGAPDEGSS